MMGRVTNDQGQLFYSFCLEEVVPDDHLVRGIAAVLDLSWVHAELAPYYPKIGRPSIDPVLMIRMLIIGYVFGIRSERLLCREVKVNMAYRWFCGLSIEDTIPDHSAFSRARNERFLNSDIFRHVFERVVQACIAAGLVGGKGFAVDASLIVADANKQRSTQARSYGASDGFWLARWLKAHGIEAHVIHASSVAVSREHRRAKTDRLDTEMLKRAFLGWLRGERDHCRMVAIPTLQDEDAKRPGRERDGLVAEAGRIVNRMKAALVRLGIRNFNAKLKKAAERLEQLRTPEGEAIPPNTLAELKRDMERRRFICEQIRKIEAQRVERLEKAPESRPECDGPPAGARDRHRRRERRHAGAGGPDPKLARP